MTRLAVGIPPVDGLTVPPGLYLTVFDKPGGQRLQLKETINGDPTDDVTALWGLLAPNGEVSVWNASLETGGFLGVDPLPVEVSVGQLGTLTESQATLYDGGGFVALEGKATPSAAYAKRILRAGPEDTSWMPSGMTLYPGAPSDAIDPGNSGSARMHAHVEGALRHAALTGDPIPWAREQLNVNLCRPVIGLFPGPMPFLGIEHPDSTPFGGYRSRGGWGSTVWDATEHFGRPAGERPSPWYPDDHLHFAAHQWIGYCALTGSWAAAVRVRAMFESLWLELTRGKWDAMRAYRFVGDIGDAALVFAEMGGEWAKYADHLLTVYLPVVLDKLDGEAARLSAVEQARGEPAAWEWNTGIHSNTDHYDDSQCPWMTGQFLIGALHLDHDVLHGHADRVQLRKQLRPQILRAIAVLLDHGYGDPKTGWYEDVSPFGETRPGSQHAITGKYRQWVLPALELVALWCRIEARTASEARPRDALNAAADKAVKRADVLARALVNGGWFGSSTAADKGWATFLADEGWMTAGRLGAVTRDGWMGALS